MIFVLAVILELGGLSGWLEQATSGFLQPMYRVTVNFSQLGISFWEKVWSFPKAAQKIQDLELRLAESSVKLGELEHLRKENEELRYLLENTDRTAEKVSLVAPVMSLARPALAGGSQQGIEQGSLIFARDTLLGRVSEVGDFSSRVVLLSEKESRSLLAKSEAGDQGVVRGDGQRVLFTEVPLDQPLQVGERVETAGQSDFPAGLFIGRISQIWTKPGDSVQTAVVEQYVSFYEASLVEVK